MTLSDISDYIGSLGLAEQVYSGRLDAKAERSIGVYDSKHQRAYRTALGGPALASYGARYVTFLIHWDKSPRETEKAGMRLLEALTGIRDAAVGDGLIRFIQPLYEPQDVGADGSGICERVIEVAVIYQKKGD